MNEKAIVEKIVKALRAKGCWVTKLHGGPMQQAGLPDLLVVWQGRAIFLEVKKPGGEATKLQLHTIEKLREVGAVAAVVFSVDEAMKVLDGSDVDRETLTGGLAG